MDSELSAVPIHFFLFADGLAVLLQLESDGGYGWANDNMPIEMWEGRTHSISAYGPEVGCPLKPGGSCGEGSEHGGTLRSH